MTLRTRLTGRFGIEHPIVFAPMPASKATAVVAWAPRSVSSGLRREREEDPPADART